MGILSTLSSLAVLTASSVVLLGVGQALAQINFGTTEPVGQTAEALLANSDTRISIPFTRPAEYSGQIASISGNVVTVNTAPNWVVDQFVYVPSTQPKTYYAIIGPNFASLTGTLSITQGGTTVTGTGTTFTQLVTGDEIVINGTAAVVAAVNSATSLTLVSPFVGATVIGASAIFDHSPKEGCYYTVTANGTNSLTVDLNGDSLSSIAGSLGNTTVTLIPYWTLGTAFPAWGAGASYVASTGAAPRFINTEILLPDRISVGVNLATTQSYFNYNGAWRELGQDPNISCDDTVLLPTSYFIVRNKSITTTFAPIGSVYMNRLSIPLATSVDGQQDNAVALSRPVNATLNDLGLIANGAFVVSPSAKIRGDQLLIYDNSEIGINKSASAVYYYSAGAWRSAGDGVNADFGGTPIAHGTGYTIRKATTTNGATTFWQNTRNY